MQRFYIPGILSANYALRDESIVHQVTKVLRMKEGQQIILFNENAGEVTYSLLSSEKKLLHLMEVHRDMPSREGKKKVSLMQALPNKGEKIEYIIQKGVEVGISRFTFFRSDFSQKMFLSPSKIDRFHTIAREALEQCGGLLLPEIIFCDTCPSYGDCQGSIVLDTDGDSRSIYEYTNQSSYTIWVGPEGGWSESERQKMRDNSFIFARFGERILRTETMSSVVAFSLLNA